jgi:O-6-methylguanine DNA methyltransferase
VTPAPADSTTEFARRVVSVVRRIPRGRVITYGAVARLAGFPRAARAVGRVLRLGAEPGLPYHRVIAAGGRLGGYGGDTDRKAQLLRSEGLTVSGGRIKNYGNAIWTPARTGRQRTRRPSSAKSDG